MKDPKHLWFSILMLIGTAVVFSCLGYSAAFIFSDNLLPIASDYIDVSESITTSATTSVVVTKSSTSTSLQTTISTTTKATTSTNETDAIRRKIPLNTATKEDLMMIPGIGESFAQRILDYREQIGGFTSLEQLMDIKGIGQSRYEKWSQYLTL